MYYKYRPCQILSHDFDEKSDFLNYEFLIRLSAITHFQKWPSSKESWVEGGYDVIQPRHQNKRSYFRMQKSGARFMFYPLSCVFVYTCLGKDYAVWLLHHQPRSQALSSLPPLVVGRKTLVVAGHMTTCGTNFSTGVESTNNFVNLN